ncbi:MAG: hypothetical protein KDH94_03725 [Coxiellaceae bacterium]|nr:hypothetical protein [Coxiellaceae bacterium]
MTPKPVYVIVHYETHFINQETMMKLIRTIEKSSAILSPYQRFFSPSLSDNTRWYATSTQSPPSSTDQPTPKWCKQPLQETGKSSNDNTALFLFFQSAQQHFDSKIDDVNVRFDHVNTRFDKVNERFDKVNERFDSMNNRIDDLKTEMKQDIKDVNMRFDHVNTRFDKVNERIDDVRTELKQDIKEVRTDLTEEIRSSKRFAITTTIAVIGIFITLVKDQIDKSYSMSAHPLSNHQ